MSAAERALWLWDDDSCECKACNVKEKMEKIKYERERKFYNKAKTELYPRPEPQQNLRRIGSDEHWQNTSSFYQAWRLPSALAHLMSPLTERKGTGFVGDNTDAAGNTNDAQGSPQSTQLEQLDEGLEAVEEESLGDSGSEPGSVHSGRSFHEHSPRLVAQHA